MANINFQNVHTMIGADAIVAGSIDLQEGIIIYGNVQGDVTSFGPVRVAKGAIVYGNIFGSDIQISGQVTGNVTAKGQVILGEESVLKGDIIYQKLHIEDGAKFEGKCDLVSPNQTQTAEG